MSDFNTEEFREWFSSLSWPDGSRRTPGFEECARWGAQQPNEILFTTYLEGRAGIKKNSLQRKFSFKQQRTLTMPSDRYLDWERFTVVRLKRVWGFKPPISEPVIMRAVFGFKNHQHEADLSNLYEGIQDALQKAGVLVNDKLIYGHDGSRKVFGIDEGVSVQLIRLKSTKKEKISLQTKTVEDSSSDRGE